MAKGKTISFFRREIPHLISVTDLTKNDILYILEKSKEMEKFCIQRELQRKGRKARKRLPFLANATMFSIFDEPSTRTDGSFEGAMILLGGDVKNKKLENFSMSTKGESLKETIKLLSKYPSTDIIVIRHHDENLVREAASNSYVPILNAGNGTDEHPSQGLLDLLTIKNRKGKIDGLEVSIAGDLKHARTIHSLALILSYFDVRIKLISQEELQLPSYIEEKMRKINPKVKIEKYSSLNAALKSDVLYLPRLQKDRIPEETTRAKLSANYPEITKEFLGKAKKGIILMSPGPRREEFPEWTDSTPNSAYYEGVLNGFYVRMALLNLILIKQPDYPE